MKQQRLASILSALSLSGALFLAPNTYAVAKSYQLAPEQVLFIGNGTEPKDLDPSIVTGVPESNVTDNLFEGLTSLHPFTLEALPGMAESWEISPDGKIYKFKLRKTAKWSDGKPLTAADFVYSWTRVLEPKTASEYAYQLYYVKNGEAFNTGKIKDSKQLGIKALDPYTLEVTLENPTPYFLRLTAFHTLFPVPKHVVEKFGQAWTKEGNMVSNGPFKLAEWKLNQDIKLVPNDQYWDKSVIKLKEVIFYPTENVDTEEKTFTAGKLHMTATVPALKIPYYSAQAKKNSGAYNPYRNDPYLGAYYFRFNVTKAPTSDARVRRALALTVDRKLIVERVTKGGQIPASTYTPPVAGYEHKGSLPISVTPQVIAEAKKLLADAGYPEGKGMPPVQILYNTSEDHKRIAVAIQQMWKKNLGIEVELFNQEWKVYLDTTRKLDYTLSRAGWIGDYPDPNTFLDMFVTNGGNNQTGWSNKAYDDLIDKAAQTIDQTTRYKYLGEAEDILMKDLPVLPVYIYTRARLLAEDVKMIDPATQQVTEWKGNIQDRMPFKYYVLAK